VRLLALKDSIRTRPADKKNIIMTSAPAMDPASSSAIKNEVILLSKLYAKLMLQQLDRVLEQLEKNDVFRDVTEDDLKLIEVVFKEHFQRIHNSPLSYTVNSHALMNDTLCKIARIMDREMHGQKPFLKLLIPSLRDEVACQYSVDAFRFKNVVLSGDGQSIIPIELVKNPSAFERLPSETKEQVFSQSPKAKALHLARSQSAEFPVSCLSGIRGKFPPISASMTIGQPQDEPEAISSEDECEIGLDLSLLDSAAPPVVKVDTAALNLLKANLSPYINDIFSDKEDLYRFMLDCLPDRRDWAHLMDMLGEPVLDKFFPPKSRVFSGSLFGKPAPVLGVIADDYHLAKWFCVNAAYQHQRERIASDKWFFQDSACSKAAKLAAAKVIPGLIAKGHQFGAIHAELMKLDASTYQSLTMGNLGEINSSFLDCAKEQYSLTLAARSFGK
jgi:hypothetical protein